MCLANRPKLYKQNIRKDYDREAMLPTKDLQKLSKQNHFQKNAALWP